MLYILILSMFSYAIESLSITYDIIVGIDDITATIDLSPSESTDENQELELEIENDDKIEGATTYVVFYPFLEKESFPNQGDTLNFSTFLEQQTPPPKV